MSGLGAGIAAMVNGFVGGREIRNRWEDRKDEKEWQKKLREYRANAEKRLDERQAWAEEQQGWARDQHGVNMAASGRAQKEWDQNWADQQAMRDALGGAVDAAEEGIVDAPADETASVSTKSPQPALGATRDSHISQPIPPVSRQTPDAPPPSVADTVPAAPRRASTGEMGAAPAEGAFLRDMGDGTVIATRPPRDAAEQAQLAQAAKEGRLSQDPQAAARQAEVDRIGTARATANGMQRAILPDPEHEYGRSGGAGADVVEGAKAVGRLGAGAVDAAANLGVRGVRQVNQVVNPVAEWITGKDFGSPKDADWSGGAMDAMPAPPKGATKAEAATAAATAQVMDAVGDDPAMKAAAEGTPMGAQPGQPMTVRQRDNAATTFMESYRKNGVPLIQKELMRQGRFKEAEGLTAFINDQAAQEGMRNWSRGVFAAMNGDLDAAADAMIDAYNSSGYFDDGFEIVKEQSSLIKDKGGEVTGVKLAMRNQQTGEVTVQEDSISDVITKGLWLTSPEKAMETYIANQQAMQARLIEADAKRQDAAIDLIKQAPKEIREMAQFLMEQDQKRREASFGRDDTPPLTIEEAMAQAQAVLAGGGAPAAAAGDTPVLRRGG